MRHQPGPIRSPFDLNKEMKGPKSRAECNGNAPEQFSQSGDKQRLQSAIARQRTEAPEVIG